MKYRQTVVFEYQSSAQAPRVGTGTTNFGPGVVVAVQFSDALRELEYLAERAEPEDRVAAFQYAHALESKTP